MPEFEQDPLWYKDAIIYEIHVRSFYDSVEDGMGDFAGLTQKLDYIQDLGVTAVWILPFCPSPWRDDGYDISDYTDVHPAYGTLEDFKKFLEEAHRRGIRVITELVMNHTSDQHAWFQKSRRAEPGSYWRNFYVWSDTPERFKDARIIFKDFETSNWTWDPVGECVFLAPLFLPPAGPEFRQSGSGEGDDGGARFLAGYGSRWAAAGCGPVSVRARGDELRDTRAQTRPC